MRLIDADNLLKIFDERLKVYEGENGTKERYAYMAWLRSYHAIKDAPTIDAVEVVRCKNCKHAYKRKPINKTAVLCELFGAGMKDNDFCSHGERSEE